MEVHCVSLELKYQNQALKSGQHGHVLKDIDNIATIHIELEHNVVKLLQENDHLNKENEHLNKENEHLKMTYKDLFNSIKPSRAQTKVHNDSLIAQLNKKSIKNADLRAQLQDKIVAYAEIRERTNQLKGKSVKTKFEKPSVARQPNAFKFQKPSVLGKPTLFSNSFEKRDFSNQTSWSVPKTNMK
ncbi:hypothetical protein Tco_0709434 [Tanacetum coccineum]